MTERHRVATVICDQAKAFELATPVEVFGTDRSYLGVPWYEHRLCAASTPVSVYGGFTINTQYGLDELALADTIIIAPTNSRCYPSELLEHLVNAHQRGARLVTLCTGAFIVAEAGLLDGRRVTTHWMRADEFATSYPKVVLDANVLYVDDGDILTSAGTAASIDLCLHVVRNDFGAEIANDVARRMVVPPHREGGQAQFVDRSIDATSNNDLFADTLSWVEDNLHDDITVDDLAKRSAMSPRTFARRFKSTTGTTPHNWIIQRRVHLAQRLLETTDRPISHVATDSGFGSATNLRNHFQRSVHTTPTSYRSMFRLNQSA